MNWENFELMVSKTNFKWPQGYWGPFKLYDYHKRLFEGLENNRHVLFSKFRQGGFSTFCHLYALAKAREGRSVAVVYRTQREAASAAERLHAACASSNSTEFNSVRYYSSRCGFACSQIDGDTGKVDFITWKHLQGRTYNHVFLDEFAFYNDGQKALDYAHLAGGCVTVYSTINKVGDDFWSLQKDAHDGKNNYQILVFDYREHPEYNDPKWVEETRKTLGEKSFQQEVLRNYVQVKKDIDFQQLAKKLEKIEKLLAEVKVEVGV